MFYSPFTDDNGVMKYIHEVNFEDLKQLKEKDVSEGISIEYKREYSPSVQKKIPNIISSFANEKGGWIFVGIDENDKDITPIDKKDYELTLNNQLRDLVNPKPRIQTRLICERSDDSKGVLVIYVGEGDSPPYISSGKIYRRIGSGTNQVKEIEDRYHLDKLYEKSKIRDNEIEKFCVRSISINNSYWDYSSLRQINQGMLNMYILPRSDIFLLDEMEVEEFVNYVMEESKKSKTYATEGISLTMNLPFSHYTISHNSVIFRNTDILDHIENTIALEVFFDGSAKIHIPLPYRSRQDIVNDISRYINNYKDIKTLERFKYVDGATFFFSVYAILAEYLNLIKKIRSDINEFIFVQHLEDVQKDALYFEVDLYKDILKKRGLIFSERKEYTTNKNYEYIEINEENIYSLMFQLVPIFNMFGLTVTEGIDLFIKSVQERN